MSPYVLHILKLKQNQVIPEQRNSVCIKCHLFNSLNISNIFHLCICIYTDIHMRFIIQYNIAFKYKIVIDQNSMNRK